MEHHIFFRLALIGWDTSRAKLSIERRIIMLDDVIGNRERVPLTCLELNWPLHTLRVQVPLSLQLVQRATQHVRVLDHLIETIRGDCRLLSCLILVELQL